MTQGREIGLCVSFFKSFHIRSLLMKQIRQSAMAAALAVSLVVGSVPSAMAVTPDNGAPLSGWWNTGRVLKEWLDWRSALGWGLIGASNTLITATTGASRGQLTRAAVQGACGTTAAGLMATWTPRTEPTVASHIKSVVKAASVTGASSVCGWLTQAAFNAIDSRVSRAQEGINSLNGADFQRLRNTMVDLNNEFLAFERTLQEYQDYVAESTSALQSYTTGRCTDGPRSSGPCLVWWNNYRLAENGKAAKLDEMNSYGKRVTADMQTVNNIVKAPTV